jgi:hypothetical protein
MLDREVLLDQRPEIGEPLTIDCRLARSTCVVACDHAIAHLTTDRPEHAGLPRAAPGLKLGILLRIVEKMAPFKLIGQLRLIDAQLP